ncbi:amidase [Corallococcus macrosporus]|uniref:Amidase n=1 Tax=Corallococcus macrosporus DSM 14697 TaxID=1189310 RepID=A0A250JTK0_9BACT|nr:amidase [Corallococcus macrosporus]ATB47209.1 amidase [Corallococcus macrosporus DSM 14697]
MNLDDYSRCDAVGLAELVRRKEVSPEALLRVAVEAIHRVNPELNAVIDTRDAQAREALEQGLPDGPFRGVPFLIKDIGVHAAGVPSDFGSRLTQGTVFPHDSALMARYRRAGLVLLGRTNTPEFGNNASTEPRLHGPTRNPWDVGRSPGGSSGGSAAAVAAGIVPVAHGNDGGGSLRIPASLCGVFGLKPTRGRNSLGPDAADIICGMGIEHVLSRSVRDSAAALDATQGPEAGDPYFAPPPRRPYLEEVSRAPGRLRIALMTASPMGGAVSPECIEAARRAARLCEELGHDVTEDALPHDGLLLHEAITTAWSATMASLVAMASHLSGREAEPDSLEATTWAVVRHGQTLTATELMRALGVFNLVSRQVGRFFQQYDVLLSPTVAAPPFPLGLLDANAPRTAREWYDHAFGHCPFTAVFNVTGQPAMSVPLHWSEEGLPIGVQFAGRYADEATLFRLAGQLEQARPWAQRRPPVHVTRTASPP